MESKDPQIIKQEIENMFNQLESEPKNDTNVTDSLQNLSIAIEKRRKSETLMSNGKCEKDAKFLEEVMEHLEKLVEPLINKDDEDANNDQNDKNRINIDDSMNKSIISGETMEEMKAKFLKHQQIYKTNYELAETEIKRMDELYQDLIETVLKVRYGTKLTLQKLVLYVNLNFSPFQTLNNIPDVVNAQTDLKRLKEMLESETSLTSPTNGFGNKKVSLENSFKSVQEDNLSL